MRRRAFCALVAACGAACVLPARGAQVPVASKGDARIRFVDYDPYNVVTIYGQVGISTMIVFAPDEMVIDKGSGDSQAWDLGVHSKHNGFSVKPKAAVADTNIQIITNKRAYNFDLKLATGKQAAFWAVYFRYPAAARAQEAKAQEADQVRALLDRGAPAGNRRYTVEGSSDLAPAEVWDDGIHTYFRFAERARIPAVYGAGHDDDASLERIDNQSTRPDGVLQVPGVRRKFVLRIGREVACVYNEGYDPAAPRPATNTVSPAVRRVIKGGQP